MAYWISSKTPCHDDEHGKISSTVAARAINSSSLAARPTCAARKARVGPQIVAEKDLSVGLQGCACLFEVRSLRLPTVAKTGSSCGTVFGVVPHLRRCEGLGHGMQRTESTGCPIA
jgi:hypothetical protein